MAFRLLILSALVATSIPFAAAAEQLKLDREKSKIQFIGAKSDGTHEGGFKTFRTTAIADFEEPRNGSLEIVIDTTSLWSDNEKLTNHLKNPDFFNVRKHPTIIFKSKEIVVGEEDGKAKIIGTLTMLDKSAEIEVPVETEATENEITLNADFKLDRTKWGMTYGEGKIDNDVKIKSVLVFTR